MTVRPPGRRRPGGRGRTAAAALVGVIVLGVAGAGGRPAAASGSAGVTRAEASWQALRDAYYQTSTGLYVRPGSGLPENLWPFDNAFAAAVALVGTPGEAQHLPDVAAGAATFLRYVDTQETSPDGRAQPPGLSSAVQPPLGPGGDTYYDDNAWAALGLLRASTLLAEPAYLGAAQQLFAFITTGWSTDATLPCPGGVRWVDAAWNGDRNTVSTASAAQVAAELYLATGDRSYLSWAERLYGWVRACLLRPDALYNDHIATDGTVESTPWSYNQGLMVGAGVLLARATGSPGYLDEAAGTAAAAVARYGTGSTLDSQGAAFNAIYFANLLLLDSARPDPSYRAGAQSYADTMWDTRRDPSTGLFTPAGVNGTAPMVSLYSMLAGSPPLPVPAVRVAGQDRISTAVAASAARFPAGAASTVVLAGADDYPDALAGAPLAAVRRGPLLLTPADTLDQRTAAELRRVIGPGGTVALLGGPAALSDAVEGAVRAAVPGAAVVRLAGRDRFQTAVSVAGAMGDPARVFEADGTGFADAVIASSAAASSGAAVLLTDGSASAPATTTYLRLHPGDATVAVGAPAVAADPAAGLQIAGADRYETAAAVAGRLFPAPARAAVATGAAYPDALVAAAVGGPLLLTTPDGSLPAAEAGYLAGASPGAIRVFGGTGAVPSGAVLACQYATVSLPS